MTFLDMASMLFGGNPRDMTYIVRCAITHLHDTFYNKISGDSMRYWVDYIDDFRTAIYNRLTNNPRYWESIAHPDIYGPMDLFP